MTNILSNHRFLWQCLSPVQTPATVAALRGEMVADNIAWDEVVRIADRELLSATLCGTLAERGLIDAVPQSISNALLRRLTINGVRNERIKHQASEIVATLNRIEIEPIILKGGLHLFESSPADLGTRMMRDLDFMVPKDKFEKAVECLSVIGYRPDIEDGRWTYHYRPLSRAGEFAPVDVHRYVGEQKDILPCREAWQESIPVPAGSLQLRTLCPTHNVLHNIFHSQIQDRGHELGLVNTRQLHALAALCMNHAAAINWDALRWHMDSGGLGHHLRARIYQAAQLFAIPSPPELSPTLEARLHHRRCLLQLRWPWVMRLVHQWAAATQPFKRHHMDLTYGCGTNPIKVNVYRVRHVWYLFSKYRGRIRSKIMENRGMYN